MSDLDRLRDFQSSMAERQINVPMTAALLKCFDEMGTMTCPARIAWTPLSHFERIVKASPSVLLAMLYRHRLTTDWSGVPAEPLYIYPRKMTLSIYQARALRRRTEEAARQEQPTVTQGALF